MILHYFSFYVSWLLSFLETQSLCVCTTRARARFLSVVCSLRLDFVKVKRVFFPEQLLFRHRRKIREFVEYAQCTRAYRTDFDTQCFFLSVKELAHYHMYFALNLTISQTVHFPSSRKMRKVIKRKTNLMFITRTRKKYDKRKIDIFIRTKAVLEIFSFIRKQQWVSFFKSLFFMFNHKDDN